MTRKKVMKNMVFLFVLLMNVTVWAKEYHVSVNGKEAGDGSAGNPFRRIQAAADIAQPGDVITVHEGLYRERVNPPRGGECAHERIVYRAAPGEKVEIRGSEVVTGWEKMKNDTWKVTVPNRLFGDFNPFNDVVEGEWYHRTRKDMDRHTGMVYLNGTWFGETLTVEEALMPVGEEPFWTAVVDRKNTTIWAQFKDVNPNRETTEINVRQSIFYPDKPGRNYITVRGFIMRHAATPWSGSYSEQIGLIGTHWSKGWIIEDCVISHSFNSGITLGRYDLVARHGAKPAPTDYGMFETIRMALDVGYSHETIGHHIVRNNHISHCEMNGIHSTLGAQFSVIEGNTIHDISVKRWVSGPDMGGMMLVGTQELLIRNNHVYRCDGPSGIWCDWLCHGTRITGNLLHDNGRRDLFIEVSHGPYLVDHNILLSKSLSHRQQSQGGAYAHNIFASQIQLVTNPERVTPYFKPHTLEDMKYCGSYYKDVRVHNNLFFGEQTAADFGIHVQESGNVQLQKNSFKLEEKADGFYLTLPDIPGASGEKRALVTTKMLGKAKIPNVPFVKPDDSPYRLDTDYFGKQRNADNPAPGPFAFSDNKSITIKVWPRESNK